MRNRPREEAEGKATTGSQVPTGQAAWGEAGRVPEPRVQGEAEPMRVAKQTTQTPPGGGEARQTPQGGGKRTLRRAIRLCLLTGSCRWKAI